MKKLLTALLLTSCMLSHPRQVHAHVVSAQHVHLGALAFGKILRAYSNTQTRNKNPQSASLARAGTGLCYMLQAASLYKLQKNHGAIHRELEPNEEQTDRPHRYNLLALNMLKAGLGAYYHSVGGKENKGKTYTQHAVWNGLLAALSLFAKCYHAYASRGEDTEFYVSRDTSLRLPQSSTIGQGLDALVCFFEYLEVHGYLSAFNEFRVLNTPDLCKVTPLKTPPGESTCCVGCGKFQAMRCGSGAHQPIHEYCHASQGNCGYHQACLQKMLADGKTVCPVCDTVFRYELESDVLSHIVKLLQIVLLPVYFAL